MACETHALVVKYQAESVRARAVLHAVDLYFYAVFPNFRKYDESLILYISHPGKRGALTKRRVEARLFFCLHPGFLPTSDFSAISYTCFGQYYGGKLLHIRNLRLVCHWFAGW